MEESIKRLVNRAYPELTAGHHLPRFARVVTARETPQGGEIHDDFKPVYAVDVEVLDAHGEPDKAFPVYRDVPLPVPVGGNESGFFAYPENGAQVEVAFAYGSPNKPFIRTILPHGLSLTPAERGEMRLQHNPEAFTRFDKDGNHETRTDLDIIQDSLKRLITAMDNRETYTVSNREVKGDETGKIGGAWTLKAAGIINMLSGGRFDLGALKDLNLTSLTKNKIKAPKTWLGSQDENVLRILSELMQLHIDLCSALASHTHSGVQTGTGDTAVPVQASTISGNGNSTGGVKGRLDGIKE